MSDLVFYLSSLESVRFSETRECHVVRTLEFSSGKPCALVKISPVVIGQQYGLGAEDIEYLVLTSRHEGETVAPEPSEYPCFIHIARPLFDVEDASEVIETSDVENLAWGEVYRTRNDADNHIFNP